MTNLIVDLEPIVSYNYATEQMLKYLGVEPEEIFGISVQYLIQSFLKGLQYDTEYIIFHDKVLNEIVNSMVLNNPKADYSKPHRYTNPEMIKLCKAMISEFALKNGYIFRRLFSTVPFWVVVNLRPKIEILGQKAMVELNVHSTYPKTIRNTNGARSCRQPNG